MLELVKTTFRVASTGHLFSKLIRTHRNAKRFGKEKRALTSPSIGCDRRHARSACHAQVLFRRSRLEGVPWQRRTLGRLCARGVVLSPFPSPQLSKEGGECAGPRSAKSSSTSRISSRSAANPSFTAAMAAATAFAMPLSEVPESRSSTIAASEAMACTTSVSSTSSPFANQGDARLARALQETARFGQQVMGPPVSIHVISIN